MLVAVVLLLSGLIVYLRTFRFPAPTGPHLVGTTLLDLTDPNQRDPSSTDPNASRELVVQLWYPAEPSQNRLAPYMRWREAGLSRFYAPLLRTHSRMDAPVVQAGGPYPVLLFNQRWNGQRTQNTSLAEDLASHGYVVASIDHPGNSSRVLLAGGRTVRGTEVLEGPMGAAATALQRIVSWNNHLHLWAQDSRFVLDQLAARSANASDPFHGRLDTAHAGAFGHSFGGATALALCGPGPGTSDPRIKSAVNLDGWTFAGLAERNAGQQILLLYEGISQDREKQVANLPQLGSVQDRLDLLDFADTEASLHKYGGYRLFLAGTQHMDFSDEPLLPPFRRLAYTGPISPQEGSKVLRQVVLQFFDQTLRNKPSAILTPDPVNFPELTVEHWHAISADTKVTSKLNHDLQK